VEGLDRCVAEGVLGEQRRGCSGAQRRALKATRPGKEGHKGRKPQNQAGLPQESPGSPGLRSPENERVGK